MFLSCSILGLWEINVPSDGVIGVGILTSIVWVEVELVAVASDLSVPGLPVGEGDSAKVREQDAWVLNGFRVPV